MKQNFTKTHISLLCVLLLTAFPHGSFSQVGNYEGVMLQGFEWDLYFLNGKSLWAGLTDQADEIARSFDLVWLPPSGNANGSPEYPQMGYHPIYYFDQNSSFGTKDELKTLIATLKSKGTGAIADIVINHRNGVSNWTNFPVEIYKGIAYIWGLETICSNDEVAGVPGQETPTGNSDEGEGWDGARDIDHTNATVQATIKAYLDFMKNEMGYVGWRFDFVKGFAPYYVAKYTAESNVDFAVGECWDNNYNVINDWLQGQKWYPSGQGQTGNIVSGAFDFPLKNVLNAACNDNNWSQLVYSNQPAGLIGNSDYRRFSYTFVDNHDTRGKVNSLNNNRMAAYAFILTHPGLPTVFYPDWTMYKDEIRQIIALRKLVGITNTSSVEVVASADGDSDGIYTAKINGSRGSLFVKVGPRYNTDVPSGYGSARVSGDNYAVWALPTYEEGTLTANPSPVRPNQNTVLHYDGTGTNFASWSPLCFIHAWLEAKPGETFSNGYTTTWEDGINSEGSYNALDNKLKMTKMGTGLYDITLNIKDFFNVADEDLGKIRRMGVIVRAQFSGNSNRTGNMYVDVNLTPLIWQGSSSTDWNTAANWSPAFVPVSTDEVVIPATASIPVLSTPVSVRSITLKPHAELKGQQYLTGKVFVEYDFSGMQSNQWGGLLSIPLMEVYGGDFTFGGYPKTTIDIWQPVGSGADALVKWEPGSMTTKMTAGDPFFFYKYDVAVSATHGLGANNNILTLPYFDNPTQSFSFYNGEGNYFYSYKSDGDGGYLPGTVQYSTPRSDAAYRIVQADMQKTLIFGKDTKNAEYARAFFAASGNPFVSSFNFSDLCAVNPQIKQAYKLWENDSYADYSTDGIPLSSIPPWTGFIVESVDGLPPANTSFLSFPVTLTGGAMSTTQSGFIPSDDGKIFVTATSPAGTSHPAVITKRSYGQSVFGNYDSGKLLAEANDIPQIYTLKTNSEGGMTSTAVNVVSVEEMTIPLEIRTSFEGNMTLNFKGMDKYDGKVFLFDRADNKEVDLTGKMSCDYSFSGPFENRFAISLAASDVVTVIDNHIVIEDVSAYIKDGVLCVMASHSNRIKFVEIYSAVGALLYAGSYANAITVDISRKIDPGVYVLKVSLQKGMKNIKVIVK
jgi:hypothetical protein